MFTLESYTTQINGASHWSLVVRRGSLLTLTDLEGGANVGMLFYNPYMLGEKYNAPDTLKCQHTFKLTRGNCLYSDMGRIFCSIVDDDFGWHDTVCGNTHAEMIEKRWGSRNYQVDRNLWKQNGYDSFLVELAKYKLDRRSLAMNVNFFSEVATDFQGGVQLRRQANAGDELQLRFEMDTLVLMHTCPHPLNTAQAYPNKPVQLALTKAEPVGEDDYCLNFRPENRRGFENNALYHFGM